MPLDASIYNALGVQPKSQADYADEYDRRDIRKLQLVGAQRQNELAAMTSQQQQQNMQRNTLVQAAQRQAAEKAGGNVSAYADNLYLSGYPELIDPAEKVQKGLTERGKVASENAKRDTETENAVVGMWRDMIGNSVNQQQAAQMVAAMHADPRIAATPIARVPLEQGLQMLQQVPFDQWKQQFALGATKFVEQNKPQYITQNLGGTSRVTALPGLGAGPAAVATEAPITQDANSIASNATQVRGQNLTDARARDFNAVQVEGNNIKRAEVTQTKDLTKNSQLASFDTMLGTLERLAKHPGLSRSVGVLGQLPTMPGGESANFQAELNTFQSQAFLPMVAQLKGMGALSDAEGKKLTAAVGALDPKMGEKAFRESVDRITEEMNAARDRVSGVGGVPPVSRDKPAIKAPKVGAIEGGHRFKGGNPADPKNWEKQ